MRTRRHRLRRFGGYQIEAEPDWFQLEFYGACLLDEPFEGAILSYDYTRLNVQKVRKITREELETAKAEILLLCEAMDEAFKGAPGARPCSHCGMCDAFESCPAREAAAVETALDATLCAHCAGDERSYESFKAKGRAAYLAARRGK